MKSLCAAAVSLLILSACIGWHHEPFWKVGAARTEGLAVGSGGDGPHTFGARDYDGGYVEFGGNIVNRTVTLSEVDRELFRGGRGGNVGVMVGGAERINALTSEVATERAAAKALRDQVVHLESDLADKTRECIAVKAELLTKNTEASKLKADLAEANDWSEKVDKWIEQFGLLGSIVVLLILGLFGWLIVRAWASKPKKKD